MGDEFYVYSPILLDTFLISWKNVAFFSSSELLRLLRNVVGAFIGESRWRRKSFISLDNAIQALD